MKLHWIQHVEFEGLGAIESWARERGHVLSRTRAFDGEPMPGAGDYDVLFVMGGPMGADDEDDHPWLVAEKRAVGAAIEAGRTVVGVCLGAQVIARVLGAAVRRQAHREIGWFPVELTPAAAGHPLTRDLPRRFNAFHWHGDSFDIPAGAVHLASSEGCRRQMFAVGERVVGVQFHLEMTAGGIARLARACADELEPGRFVQVDAGGEGAVANRRLHDAHATLHLLLDRLVPNPGPGGIP